MRVFLLALTIVMGSCGGDGSGGNTRDAGVDGEGGPPDSALDATADAASPASCTVRMTRSGGRTLVADAVDLFPPDSTHEMWVRFDELSSTEPKRYLLRAENPDRGEAAFYIRAGYDEFEERAVVECLIVEGSIYATAWYYVSDRWAGTFRHVACTHDSTELALWLNGTKVSWTPGNYSYVHGSLPIAFGGDFAEPPDASQQFSRDIDEVRISNAVMYTSDFTPQRRLEASAETVALWHFDECAGDIAVSDPDSERHQATLEFGATWSPE